MACGKKHKPFILKHKAHISKYVPYILKYMPCIFDCFISLKYNNFQKRENMHYCQEYVLCSKLQTAMQRSFSASICL